MIAAIAIGGFVFAGLCGLYRMLRGPSLADRIIAVEVVLVSLVGAIAVDAANRKSATFLVTLIVIALVGLAGTFAASRFLERDVDRINNKDTRSHAGSSTVKSPEQDVGDRVSDGDES